MSLEQVSYFVWKLRREAPADVDLFFVLGRLSRRDKRECNALQDVPEHSLVSSCLSIVHPSSAMIPKVGGTAPCGAVGLPRWALIGKRGGRERCYYHRGALVDK
jgi:hypothetical protein